MPIVDRKNLEQDLRSMIAQISEAEPEKITLEASFVNDLGMDSMMALEILASMEKKFKIRIPEEQLSKLQNLKEAINLAEKYI